MKLKNKNILLTGAASGIGKQLLNLLAREPLTIMAVDRDREGLHAACSQISTVRGIHPARIISHVCDLSSAENVDRLFEKAVQTLSRIDIFIANAGFAYYEKITQPDWERIERIYRVNVFNTLYSIEKMEALFGEQPYKMVITASAMAFISVPGYAIYSSTKAALDRFADGYRWQLNDPRKLMLVYPISTRTGFFQAAGRDVPISWPCQEAEPVARAILRGIRRDALQVFPSRLFQVVLFLKKFLPMHFLVQRINQQQMNKWLSARSENPE